MKKLIAAAAIVVLALIAFVTTTFTVAEYEHAIVTRFGKIQGEAIRRAGLHFKAPFVDRVITLDNRWLEWDGDPNQIPTGDKKYIWVDTYARWRIAEPIQFYKRLRDERGAQSRLDDIIDGEIRNLIANHPVIEIVRTSKRPFEIGEAADENEYNPEEFVIELGRDALRQIVLEKASQVMPDYGIELADIRVKRINYVESVQTKVFERMISERNRIAARYRSEGQGRSAEIRGQIERELKTIQSEAYRKAEKIKGRGDAEAASIYAKAYNQGPELYAFMKTLETYRRTVDEQTTLILSTDSEFYRYLQKAKP